MGLISYGIAVGIGYHIARPGGQRRLTQLRHRVVGLVDKPQVTDLQERGRGLRDRALYGPETTGSDVVAAESSTTDTAGGRPVAAPPVPVAEGRRRRRQRRRELRRPRPSPAVPAEPDLRSQPPAGSTTVTSSPADPTGHQAT